MFHFSDLLRHSELLIQLKLKMIDLCVSMFESLNQSRCFISTEFGELIICGRVRRIKMYFLVSSRKAACGFCFIIFFTFLSKHESQRIHLFLVRFGFH